MAVYSVWKDLIRPTIITYIIVCSILAEFAGAYYLYTNYPIVLDFFASAQPHYVTQLEQTPPVTKVDSRGLSIRKIASDLGYIFETVRRMYNEDTKHYSQDLIDKLYSHLAVGVRELLEHKKDAGN